jgi:dTDP-4-dehydrorhamnose 3,5-epimerase
MHYQRSPHEETKLMRCTRGAIYDVILDIRPDSTSFGQWQALELSAENRLMVYIPPGLAHGFQTLSEESEVFYQMSGDYVPGAAAGVRWDDPAFRIHWPLAPSLISEKDRSFPLWVEASD